MAAGTATAAAAGGGGGGVDGGIDYAAKAKRQALCNRVMQQISALASTRPNLNLRRPFGRFDKNKDRKIDSNELRSCLRGELSVIHCADKHSHGAGRVWVASSVWRAI